MAELVVRGARTHNLKNIEVRIPRDRLVVISGVSGSGKSSLAFDTIFAEAQRRFVESMSTHARRFLTHLPRPDVDLIEGLSPAIAVQQRPPTRSPRSTVGTVTEVHDYLRVLLARVGRPHCPDCGREVAASTIAQMVEVALAWPEGSRLSVLAPICRSKRSGLRDELAELRAKGFVRVRLDGETRDLGEELSVEPRRAHDLDVVVDRLTIRESVRTRLAESIELALGIGDGQVRLVPVEGDEVLLSERFACPDCGTAFPELSPSLFSFNSPVGACPACDGLGEVLHFTADRVIADPTLSVREGAVAPWGRPGGAYHKHMLGELSGIEVDLDLPWEDLPASTRRALLRGQGSFEGILPGLGRRLQEYERRRREEGADEERTFDRLSEELGRFAVRERCTSCEGARLSRFALAVKLGDHDIRSLSALPLPAARDVLTGISLSETARVVAAPIVREVTARLTFLLDVGLEYLSLDRTVSTLSAGEAQRIRLGTQIGAGLVGVLYVLDEPSIGLHPRDGERLLDTLRALRDRGNTVLVVEHDLSLIRAADHLIDLGPGAGKGGGEVVAAGPPAEVAAGDARSATGAALAGRRGLVTPSRRRKGRGTISVRSASVHNLKGLSVGFPLAALSCVTGVSGSGKSSLVMDTLVPAVRAHLGGGDAAPSGARIEGLSRIERLVEVTQAPLGRTPRSSPATFTGLFKELREVFASLPEARARGYAPRRFSFNVKGGRCEACRGDGLVRVEMHFLPDVYVRCEECHGRRYGRETLEVRYRGLSIADALDLSVDDASEIFAAFPKIAERLAALREVGLGYLELGRSAMALSGGEAQRVKLARELARRATAHTLYVLDEPTTGLHALDVEVLMHALAGLVGAGHTVIVVEHDLDVMRMADHVIDLGPEGGDEGGQVVAAGSPEQVAEHPTSHTARFLRAALGRLPTA